MKETPGSRLVSRSPLATAGLLPPGVWLKQHPGTAALLLLLLAFGAVLYSSPPTGMMYDSSAYWGLSSLYKRDGAFQLLSYDNELRGYLFPLLLYPLAELADTHAILPMTLMRVPGTLMAALLFGVVGPGLWQAVQATLGQPAWVSLRRRLCFGAVGLLFWRGYFHYSLTDVPALLTLAGGLWAALRGRGLWGGALAGLLLAMSLNFRPVFAAVLPIAAVLCCWPRPLAGRWAPPLAAGLRLLGLLLGMVPVLAPQVAINRQHFGTSTPFVTTAQPGAPSLYLSQLQWGMQYQKYETNIGADYPEPQMYFIDRRGQALLDDSGLKTFENYGQYVRLLAQSPVGFAGLWLRHLFNGLDLQYTTAYIERVYTPTWAFAWLNYTLLLGGLWVLLRPRLRPPLRRRLPALLVLLGLLGPCVATLPVAMECRFLLPLHLLLAAALCFGARPTWGWEGPRWPARRWAWVLTLYGLLLTALFLGSMSAQRRLAAGGRNPFTAEHLPRL